MTNDRSHRTMRRRSSAKPSSSAGTMSPIPVIDFAYDERRATKTSFHAPISSIISRPIMICSHCAAEMPEISAYCPACGSSVNAESDPLRASDLNDQLLGALAYVAIVPAIVLLLIPMLRHRLFVRFHAWQSLLFTAAA